MMTVSKVFTLLASWADDADGKALTAPDAFAVVAAHQRAERYRAMSATIRDALAAGRVPVVVPKRARKAKVDVLTALAFWGLHGEAVQAIAAEYGLGWKIHAGFGETELAQLPSRWCAYTTERGTKIRWPSDQRIPAARFWPDGVIPEGVTVVADYPRASVEAARASGDIVRYERANQEFEQARAKFYSEMLAFRRGRHSGYLRGRAAVRAREALAARKRLHSLPKPTLAFEAPDADWHKARGYVRSGDDWVPDIQHLTSLAKAEAEAANREAREEARRVAALERACLEYGPQPEGFRDIYDDDLADAAD